MNKSSLKTVTNKKSWLLTISIGISILLLAFIVRTYEITKIPVFADEAIYIRWAQVMKNESQLRFLPLSDGKQPFFMWSIIPFFKVLQDPLLAGRMVSVFSGLLGIVGVFFLTFKLFRIREVALIAALFYAISPFMVFFDRMALVDSMLAAFGVWSLYFAVLTVKSLRLDFAMLTGFVLGLAWLTKSPALFFLALTPLTIILFDWSKKDRFTRLLKLFGLFGVSLGIAFVMYNFILRLGPSFHMIALRNKDYVFSFSEILKHPLTLFVSHLQEVLNWWISLLPGTLVLLVALSFFLNGKKYWREFLLLGFWVLVPLLVMSEIAKVFTARYILFTIPAFFVLAASFFLVIYQKKRKLLWPLAIACILPGFWSNYLLLTSPEKAPLPRSERSGYLEEWTSGFGIREVSEYLKSKDGRIIVGTEGFFGTLPDGLQIYLQGLTNITVIGVGITIIEVDSSLLDAKKAGDEVYLVVNSTRFKGDADKLGLKLIQSYPKATRPDGSSESLLFFEVTENAILPKDTKTKKAP